MLAWPGVAAWATDIHVMTSGGFTAACNELVPAFAAEQDAARALIRFFTTAAAAPVIRKTGLEPVAAP